MAKLTPAQTIGPFFHEGLKWAVDPSAAAQGSPDAVRIIGRVLDREGLGVSDALLEIWRPGWSTGGQTGIAGLQRVATDDSGCFAFLLPRPAREQVHASVTVFARGLLRGLFTRVYLPVTDAGSVVLPDSVPATRRRTLLARREASGDYQWDVCLSGADETVFFDL